MSEYHKINSLFVRDKSQGNKFPESDREFQVPEIGLIKEWDWTEKIDGTNIRIYFDPSKCVTIAGRTDRAQLPGDLLQWITKNVTFMKLAEIFTDLSVDEATSEPHIVTLYGEGYGGKIQSGSAYSPDKRFILFDVRVGKWWLSQENVNDIAEKLGIEVVHYFGRQPLEVAEAFVRAGFNSPLALKNTGTEFPAEGMIGRPVLPLFNQRGQRLIVKLKTKDFLPR